jgi:hypothetical protein
LLGFLKSVALPLGKFGNKFQGRSATVNLSWTEARAEFKSPLRAVARSLWKSRETNVRKRRGWKRRVQDLQRNLAELRAAFQSLAEEKLAWKQRAERAEEEKRRLVRTPCRLPDDPPLKGHHFGPRMISLAVNLVRRVGLRAAEQVLQLVCEWLGVKQPIPAWTTIRTWVLRLGVAALREPVERADDWVWMADHSNQIGQEKVLVGLGMRAGQMPPPGETIKHQNVRLLTVRPGKRWKREDMAAVYGELAERYGPPRAVLCDGAVELREGAECLKELGGNTIVLPDFKHKAAIYFGSAVGDHPRFGEFISCLGKSRSAIQQTELAHLTPPSQKPKARFMNMGATLEWAAMVAWLLDHGEAETRRWVTAQRLEEKLGWLRSFAPELAEWRECQQVVDRGLKFINEQGLFRGASAGLREAMGVHLQYATGRRVAQRLVDLVVTLENQLQQGERLPMSTEILESSFGLFKQLEQQHSKGGFTSLLAGFGALLKKATPETIRTAFAAVSNQDVRQWVRENLGETLGSKRLATYNEYRSATNLATMT